MMTRMPSFETGAGIDQACDRRLRRWWQKPWVWTLIAVSVFVPAIAVAIEPMLGLPLFAGWIIGGLMLFLAAWLLGITHAFRSDWVSVIFFFLIPFYFVKYAVRHWPETRNSAIAQVVLLVWLTIPFVASLPVVLLVSAWDPDTETVVRRNEPGNTDQRVGSSDDSGQSHHSLELVDARSERHQQLLTRLTYEPARGVVLRYRVMIVTKTENLMGKDTTNTVVELRLTSLGSVDPLMTGLLGKFESLKLVENVDDDAIFRIDPSAGVARFQNHNGSYSMPMNSQAAGTLLAEPVRYSVTRDAQKVVEFRIKGSLAIYTDDTPGDILLATAPMQEAFRRAADAILMPLPSQQPGRNPVWYVDDAGGSDQDIALTTEYRLNPRQPKGNSPITIVHIRGAGQRESEDSFKVVQSRLTRMGEYRFNTSGRLAESGVLVDEERTVIRSKRDGEETRSDWRVEVRFALIEVASTAPDPKVLAQFDRDATEIPFGRNGQSGGAGPNRGPELLTAKESAAADRLAAVIAQPKVTGEPFQTTIHVASSDSRQDPRATAGAAKPSATSAQPPWPIPPRPPIPSTGPTRTDQPPKNTPAICFA